MDASQRFTPQQLESLKNKALQLRADRFEISTKPNKLFCIWFNGKAIHFGLRNTISYFEVQDNDKKKQWFDRHNKILKDGRNALRNRLTESYWTWDMLYEIGDFYYNN